MSKPVLGAVVLAGGFGRRFGANKLLYPFLGKPLYLHLLDMLPSERFLRTVVVTRCPEIAVDSVLRGFSVAELGDEDTTQAHSIGRGLELLGDVDGAGFFVCDQPLLTAKTVERLTEQFYGNPHCLYAASWEEKRGNPVVFPKDCFPALMGLHADETGGAVVRENLHRLRLVSASFAEELWDVDVPEDFARLAGAAAET